jgi:hypothetical protein
MTYSCTVWRDRNFLLGPKMVEQFVTALDLQDPSSLQHALVAAARRKQGDYADLMQYRLVVHVPGQPDVDYRYSAWLDEKEQRT